MKAIDRHAVATELWDPRSIGDDVWRYIGVDPATLGSDIAGRDWMDGFHRRGGVDISRAYSVDVWSQVYTVDDFQRKEIGAEFAPVTIADRVGFHYHRAADRSRNHCHLLFPAAAGSYSIEVLRLYARSRTTSCARAIDVAHAVVPLLPPGPTRCGHGGPMMHGSNNIPDTPW
jgi:hypothetical protein